jgi:aspartate/glutamate racemase
MSSATWPPTHSDRNLTVPELLADHRERLVVEEEERVKQRARQFEELRSELNSAAVRIRAWEKMHGLRLPTNPAHPILDVIASATGVPLVALREEQQARRARGVTPPAEKGDVTDAKSQVPSII